MTRRDRAHRVDDQARTAVEKLLASGGLATEVVYQDYGEDLLTQISIDDDLQPARAWIQVKGTRDSERVARRDDTFAVRVSTNHLLRWSRSADPVVLVLWDVTLDAGWWVKPRGQIDQFDLYINHHDTQTLRVPRDQPLTADGVPAFAWEVTLEHFTNLIVQANVGYSFEKALAAADEHGDARTHVDVARGRSVVLSFDVLRLVDIIGDDGLTEDFQRMVRNAFEAFETDSGSIKSRAPADRLESAVMLAVLGAVDKRAGIGIPGILLHELTSAVMRLLKSDEFSIPGLPRPSV